LDISLKETPACWWGNHKENINDWYQDKILLHIIFGAEQEKKYMEKYNVIGKPKEHMDRCITQWISIPPKEW